MCSFQECLVQFINLHHAYIAQMRTEKNVCTLLREPCLDDFLSQNELTTLSCAVLLLQIELTGKTNLPSQKFILKLKKVDMFVLVHNNYYREVKLMAKEL